MKPAYVLLISVFSCVTAFSSIFHSYSAHLAGLELSNVCVTDDSIQSKNIISVCSQLVPVTINKGTDSEYTNWVCKKYENKKIELPRRIQKYVCTGFVNTGAQETDPYSVKCTRYKFEESYLPKTIETRQDVIAGDYNSTVWSKHTFSDCN